MSSNSSNKSPCRICLKTNVFFDWTESILEFSGPSYKECYYQYTHLQEHDEDVYTQMLCLECGNGLRNAYQLVEKALESVKRLNEMKTEINADDPLEYEKECNLKYLLNSNTKDALNTNTENQEILGTQFEEEVLNNDSTTIQDSDSKYESDGNNSSTSNNHSELRTDNVEVKPRPLLCAYCSRILYTRAHLTKHEKTHDRNRERTESCPICGLKFFDKVALKGHLPVHDENRIREFKCEFCVKAFFTRSGLNVHRRKHLGLMLKCKFCSKEYVRQYELDRHMQTHDVSPITVNTEQMRKVRAKYFMDCNTCGRKVNRSYWETHKARHLKQPLMQCGLCDKTYYNRKSVRRHIKKCHDVAEEEYDRAIIKISQKFKPQHSSLMKKQNIEIE